MLEQSITLPDELDDNNLELFLEDQTFVDYFNTFLALPCFSERVFYNKEFAQFEEFIQKLADDVGKGDAPVPSKLRHNAHFKGTTYNATNNQSRIGYYVMVLDQVQVLEFMKNFRTPIFLRSELYAEYKLTIILSTVQASFLSNFRIDDEERSATTPGDRRSIVSFNLNSTERDEFSAFGERSTVDSHIVSPHIRTIDDTFTAWQDSFKRADSRASLYSYAATGHASPMPRTPDITFDEEKESSTISSCSKVSISSQISGVSEKSVAVLQVGSVQTATCEKLETENDIEIKSHPGVLGVKEFVPEKGSKTEEEVNALSAGLKAETEELRSNLSGDNGSLDHIINVCVPCDESCDIPCDESGKAELLSSTNAKAKCDNADVDSLSGQDTDWTTKKTTEETERVENENDSVEHERSTATSDMDGLGGQGIDWTTKEPTEETERVENENDSVEHGRSTATSDMDGLGGQGIDWSTKETTEETERIENENDSVEHGRSTATSSVFANSPPYHTISVQNPPQETPHEQTADLSSKRGEEEMVDVFSSRRSSSHSDANSQPELQKDNDGIPDEVIGHHIRSVSEVSSGLSIPIIVSEEMSSGKMTSGVSLITDDSLSITREEDEENPEEQESIKVSDAPTKVELIEENEEEFKPETPDKYDERSREQQVAQGLLDLSNAGDDQGQDAGDPDVDMETSGSEYTLKGICGIFSAGRRRMSTTATSIGFDLDESDYSDDDDVFGEHRHYDLSTKEGMDEFKHFVLGSVAERYMRFWIDVECSRHVRDANDSVVCALLEKYWKTGALLELSRDAKKSLGLNEAPNVTFLDLVDQHHRILGPILSYWCPRFTIHQQNRTNVEALDYTRLSNERPKSSMRKENELTHLPLEPDACGMSRMTYNKQLVRPKTCTTANTITAKHKLRAKSAHPRLIPATTPVNTNASNIQLQNVTAPVRAGYGFKQIRSLAFSGGDTEPDYISTVRLYINPKPTPDGKVTTLLNRLQRTTVTAGQPEPVRCTEHEPAKPSDIDSLIEGLILEKQTGGYFEDFLFKIGNKQWRDCLSFWKSLQEYNALFFADSLNPSMLSRKAMLMYARYVVASGAQAIGVSSVIENQVFKQVDPPYEELFDAVEDHALRCLVEPWKRLREQEKHTYSKIQNNQILRHIEIKVMQKRRQSVIQTHAPNANEDDIEKEKISIEEANSPMPIPKDGFSFESLIRNRSEVEYFREFLSKKHGAKGIKDLMAWTEMETFRRIPRSMEEKRDKKAKDVRSAWLTKKYMFGSDSPATREAQDLIMNFNGGRVMKERPSTPVITESQKFVRARIERRWLLLFKQTSEFLERQKPRVTAPEVVEDVMLKRRLQRSEAAWKILNSRWVSSSRDVVGLRTSLLNPQSCAEFKTFVALKGDTFENDVDFWLEVQKFKDLCHAHAQDSFIRRKVQAITDCYLNSAIAPELQIDIPIEMAEKLLEKLTGRVTIHPYIFREAQMTVFRMLFNYWKEFIGYRSKVPPDETLLDHLETKLKTQRADIKAKREASERRRLARLSAEKRKKEREEREKKRMEDLSSLFSIDTASVFYSEALEDELNSWYYSKHVVEQERQEHIKKLKEQGLEIPRELLLDEKEETKSRRSRISSIKFLGLDNKSAKGKKHSISVTGGVSDKDGSDKEGSKVSSPGLQTKLLQTPKKQPAGQAPSSLLSGRRSSGLSVTLSLTRRNSSISRKSDKMSSIEEKITFEAKEPDTKGQLKDHKEESKTEKQDSDRGESTKKAVEKKKVENPKITVDEIQVIPYSDAHGAEDNAVQFNAHEKLLTGREQKGKRVLHCAPRGKKKVPLDTISCISDYSKISNIDFQQGKKRRARERTGGAATPLTFKSLKDFTDSPEGAPLAVPLPLARITSASHKEGSEDEGSRVGPTSRSVLAPLQPRLSSAKRKRLLAEKGNSVVPDVVVN